ncbi:juvenile hormone binding protein 16 [Xylocopa sonorina]|uniref:juvenile hormone binding protein 16 n=1 Tax=Xylocopa sonorina TaxID=1818115 RepID=UPI00403AB876
MHYLLFIFLFSIYILHSHLQLTIAVSSYVSYSQLLLREFMNERYWHAVSALEQHRVLFWYSFKYTYSKLSFFFFISEDYFKDCHPNVAGFDACIREALNRIQPYFKTGLPQYNVEPFDPFFAKEVSVKRGISNFGFVLTLKNVTESGWTASKVTKFVSDVPNHKIVYTQSFPEKFLSGWYEFKGNMFGSSTSNKGYFTLALYDLVQTTTVVRKPGQKMKVSVDVESIRDLKLHITNLLFGRQMLENALLRVINDAWQPGFVMVRGLINELVSTAFTGIFGNAFRNFPFEKIIQPSAEPSVS